MKLNARRVIKKSFDLRPSKNKYSLSFNRKSGVRPAGYTVILVSELVILWDVDHYHLTPIQYHKLAKLMKRHETDVFVDGGKFYTTQRSGDIYNIVQISHPLIKHESTFN